MLCGKGDQFWMTKKYNDRRAKALENRSSYSTTRLDETDTLTDTSLGGGTTNNDTYEFKQFPFPMDASIKSRKTLDIRDVDKRIGGK